MARSARAYVEGRFRFIFEAGYEVCRVECSEFYARRAQNFCNGCKEMDFILYHPRKKELWLIEVKDYQFNRRPSVPDLCERLCYKLRDTLSLLKIAAIRAPQEYPEEGISLRDMARMSEQAHKIRVAYTIELGTSGLIPPSHLLVGIKELVYRQVRFIDPKMMCLPITKSGGVGPWSIAPANGARSARRSHEAYY